MNAPRITISAPSGTIELRAPDAARQPVLVTIPSANLPAGDRTFTVGTVIRASWDDQRARLAPVTPTQVIGLRDAHTHQWLNLRRPEQSALKRAVAAYANQAISAAEAAGELDAFNQDSQRHILTLRLTAARASIEHNEQAARNAQRRIEQASAEADALTRRLATLNQHEPDSM